jgi:hypothetical protein
LLDRNVASRRVGKPPRNMRPERTREMDALHNSEETA